MQIVTHLPEGCVWRTGIALEEGQQGVARLGTLRPLLEGAQEAARRCAAPHRSLDVIKRAGISTGYGPLEMWVRGCGLCQLGKQVLLATRPLTTLHAALYSDWLIPGWQFSAPRQCCDASLP